MEIISTIISEMNNLVQSGISTNTRSPTFIFSECARFIYNTYSCLLFVILFLSPPPNIQYQCHSQRTVSATASRGTATAARIKESRIGKHQLWSGDRETL